MKPKRVLFVCIIFFIGFFMTLLFFSLSGNKSSSEKSTPSNTAQSNGYYELPQLIPSVWFVGK